MKKRKFASLVILLVSFLFAQSQKLKEVSEITGAKPSRKKEIYHVLNDSPGIKQGAYELYQRDKLTETGYYYHGLKDSVWKYYSRNKLIAQRVYYRGVKTGVWELRDTEGQLGYSFDFSNGKATEYMKDVQPDKPAFYVQNGDGTWMVDTSVVQPIGLHSSYTWQAFLNNNLTYPADAVDREVQGTIIISVLVDESGHAIDYHVIKSADPSLDKEALRVIQLFDFEFVPAEKDGKKVKFTFKQPIVFIIG